MKVLIVKVSALGDIVHSLPVLAFIKSADPRTEIDWLVEESFAPLLEGHPLLRRVHRLSTKVWRKGGVRSLLKEATELIGRLRREDYDLVFDLQGNSKSGLFTLLSGAGRRYGFDRRAVREWPNLLATNRKVRLGAAEHHVGDRALAVVRPAFPGGNEIRSAGPLAVAAAARGSVDQRLVELGLADRPVVVLHYGTTWKTKHWSLACWRELAVRLASERQIRPVLTWSGIEERAAAESIREACSERAEIWPRGSLIELAALLDRADLVVGGDTGPIHIAAAVGTPTVSMYRVTDSRRNGPRGPRHICLQAPLDCSPCLQKSCRRDAECGSSISVEEVFRAIHSLLPAGESR